MNINYFTVLLIMIIGIRENIKKMNWTYPSLIALITKEQLRNFQDYRFSSNKQLQRFKPHMTNREIIIIEELLRNLQPKRCLEWGSGYSTIYFPKFLASDSDWFAIEHYPEWADKVNELNKNPRVKSILVPPNVFPWTDEHDDGSYSDLIDYVDYPNDIAPFDFILIDGRSRIACIKRAFEWITEKGIVVLHDSNREYYHPALVNFPNQIFFHYEGRRDKGLWFGSKGFSIDTYFNAVKHKKLWEFHNCLRRRRKR